MKRAAAFFAAILTLAACGGGDDQRVVVAAGTTLVDSGFVDALAEFYEADGIGVEVSVVGEASAQVLELGRRGAADVLITHAPALEAEFVAEGRAARYEEAFSSRFVLAGPAALVNDLEGQGGAVSVMAEIARRQLPFVSRGDGSGTQERELALWAEAGVDPAGASWYSETGQGMGLTMIVADQTEAFTLAELGAFTVATALSLVPVDVGDGGQLVNPYHVTAVANSDVGTSADMFVEWLVGPLGRQAIESINDELFGAPIYTVGG